MTCTEMRDCHTCGRQQMFAAPGCVDGHGADCPDLACVECGEAIFLGLFSVQRAGRSPDRPRVAPAA